MVHCLLVFIPHTDQDGDDEAYEDGEDDLASDAAGVQKEARSSEAAQSRGRTATLVWSGLAGWGETFWEFEIAHRMNLQLKRLEKYLSIEQRSPLKDKFDGDVYKEVFRATIVSVHLSSKDF